VLSGTCDENDLTGKEKTTRATYGVDERLFIDDKAVCAIHCAVCSFIAVADAAGVEEVLCMQ